MYLHYLWECVICKRRRVFFLSECCEEQGIDRWSRSKGASCLKKSKHSSVSWSCSGAPYCQQEFFEEQRSSLEAKLQGSWIFLFQSLGVFPSSTICIFLFGCCFLPREIAISLLKNASCKQQEGKELESLTWTSIYLVFFMIL